jgi:hypothetical protein
VAAKRRWSRASRGGDEGQVNTCSGDVPFHRSRISVGVHCHGGFVCCFKLNGIWVCLIQASK